MSRIRLDQSKLLGFRIEPVEGNPAKLGAKVGDKGRQQMGAKIGPKIGTKPTDKIISPTK